MRHLLVTLVWFGCHDKNADRDPFDVVTDPSTELPPAGSNTVSLLEAWTLAAQSTDTFFAQLAGVGDVNGDGFDDVVVASLSDSGSRSELYAGSSAGLGVIPSWGDERTTVSALRNPSAAGDVNGDGFGDVLFGSGAEEGPDGRAVAFYGSASGLPEVADWQVVGEPGVARYTGVSCAAGDVNGDGFGDVLVSDIESGWLLDGKVYTFLGSADGLDEVASWTAEGEVGSWFGYSVAGAGDVNGDGYDDVVIGAPAESTGGSAYVYLGSASGLTAAPAWVGRGDESLSTWTGYGFRVAGAGDVNGDGYDDLLVGAPWTMGTAGSNQGRAHVILGSPTGPTETWSWEATSHQPEALYGIVVAGAGDLNGDGFQDVAIGAPTFDDVEDDEGLVEVFLGSPTGVRRQRGWVAGSGLEGGWYGVPLGSAGDVDGDGFDDLLVGAMGYENPDGQPGRVWAYTGGDLEE